jgi:hypothetical protein
MYSDVACAIPEGRCADQIYRLSVYEAGHALTARALGLKVISVRILPRPPVLISDKTFTHNNWESFIEMLEIRIIELFGGQIAEEHACNSNTCCSGDIARIDELARLVAGLGGEGDPEEIFFRLEDFAQNIFADRKFKDAILPLAEFLNGRVKSGNEEISGADVEAEMDKLVPPLPKQESWVGRVFSFGKKKAG